MGANFPDENRRRGAEEDPRVRGIGDDEHIIKGRPIGVRFECGTQTSPERSTLL